MFLRNREQESLAGKYPEPGDVTRRLSQLYRMKANKTFWDTIQKISYIYRAREKQQIGKLRHQTS